MRRRRGEPASRSTILITAANGTARMAPTTPRSERAIRTATIVVNAESSTARRYQRDDRADRQEHEQRPRRDHDLHALRRRSIHAGAR